MISQIPPNHTESPSQGTRLGLKERASDQVRHRIQRVELRGFDSLWMLVCQVVRATSS